MFIFRIGISQIKGKIMIGNEKALSLHVQKITKQIYKKNLVKNEIRCIARFTGGATKEKRKTIVDVLTPKYDVL